jgi:hypothetical protein
MRLALVSLTVIAMTVMLAGQERDRAKVPDALKWNLADIYPSESAWRAQKEKIEKEIPKLREFQGTLGSSPKALADAQHAVRPGHAPIRSAGNAAGDAADLCEVRR